MELRRENIARRIWSACSNARKEAESTEEEVDFVNSLLQNNGSVAIDGVIQFALPRSNVSGYDDAKCSASIRGKLSWNWSDISTVEKCTGLIISLATVSLTVSKKNNVEDDLSEKMTFATTVDSSDEASADPLLAKWLYEVSPLTRINIESMDLQFDDPEQFSMNDAIQYIYSATQKGILHSLVGHRHDSAANSFPFERVSIKEINASCYKSNEKESGSFQCQFHNFSCCREKWVIEEAYISIPLFFYRIDIQSSGVHASHHEDGLHLKIKTVNSCRLSNQNTTYFLKHILRYTIMKYDHGGAGLRINLADKVVFGEMDNIQQIKTPPHSTLEFPLQIEAAHVSKETKAGDMIFVLENGTLTLVPMPQFQSTVTASFHANKMNFRNLLKVDLFTCQLSVNTSSLVGDNFSADVQNASFVGDSLGVKWLNEIIDDAKHAKESIQLPFAQISGIKVSLFPKGLMTVFQSNVIELSPIDAREYETSSTIILSTATKLLNEVNRRRNMQKDKRADMADSAAVTAGGFLMGASMATPVGAAVAVASLGVRDSVGNTIAAGKESRGVSEHERYRVGDFSRGLAKKFSNSSTNKSDEKVVSDSVSSSEGGDLVDSERSEKNAKKSVLKDKKRLAGVGGMSAGAVVGSILLGPVGLIGGSMIGSRMAKASVKDDKKDEDIVDEGDIRKDDMFENPEQDGDECRDSSSEW
mmetsp:Transcript_14434/g.30346  ORF Transcript_14434/g.30346 Transcript_14434/m.30346 type:complete len:701 (-) Transcript_14434:211-2313(-)|eukprot:CAMPEP_0171373674 /NCGR_PEP_ID=MMETSP0879-20121228/13184_1 /TAXON_ID=67004 /ORGANISM="Thalassiosira weissflogii, Strain CCMP1336" /LENGTH=700 /DNA_ID=CAMNT_0011882857 /DNA_START=30 /DNA_END=2129 /DNA_ORIENTATION=+